MVGPVAALPADGLAVTLAEELAELGRGDELEFVRAILTVPAFYEFRHPRIGRAVVNAHRMRRLAVEEICTDNPGRFRSCSTQRGRQPLDKIPVAETRLAAAEEIVVAVPGQTSPPLGPCHQKARGTVSGARREWD